MAAKPKRSKANRPKADRPRAKRPAPPKAKGPIQPAAAAGHELSPKPIGPWPHRLAWALVCAAFPLIWMGGLVTSFNAGMAVPDWPGTYGYNLFLYPIESWIKVWDVFLEHSHRLIGAATGIITIALSVLLYRRDPRRWVQWLGLAAVAGVCFQGTLGGIRVIGPEVHDPETTILWVPAMLFLPLAAALMATAGQLLMLLPDQRWRLSVFVRIVAVSGLCYLGAHYALRAPGDKLFLAKVHGCTAPVFFVLAAALVTFTSRSWLQATEGRAHRGTRLVRGLAVVATVGLYVQIVLGANLRHIAPEDGPGWFDLCVWLHLINAGLVTIVIAWLVVFVLRRFRGLPLLRSRVKWLAGLFVIQLLLGAGTWVTNFGFPAWFLDYFWAIPYTVQAESFLQAVTTTAHVAFGALNLVTASSLALWSFRLARPGYAPAPAAAPA